jgi:hypothetical protein
MTYQEEWRPIPDYNHYYDVSSFGRVRSWLKVGRGTEKRDQPKILKQTPGGNSYLSVKLWKNNHPKTQFVHQVVARAFYGECKTRQIVSHIDENKYENSVWNLCYESQSEKNSRPKRIMRSRISWKIGVSGFRGVLRNKKKWIASIAYKKKRYYLGEYDSKIRAAEAYDKKSIELYGKYAVTNKMLGLF